MRVPKLKCQQQKKWFVLNKMEVKPFNGETVNQPGWSHGFAHYRDRQGKIGFCGTSYFEKHAVPVKAER